MTAISILALLSGSHASRSAAEPELLEPEKAFQFSARLLDADRQVEVQYVIAPGYYLYREKFKFRADTCMR